jgi:hypothetical protein
MVNAISLLLSVVMLAMHMSAIEGQDVPDEKTCVLPSVRKPLATKPSFHQCYFFNEKSCCTSLHDDGIADFYNTLLSGTALNPIFHVERDFTTHNVFYNT